MYHLYITVTDKCSFNTKINRMKDNKDLTQNSNRCDDKLHLSGVINSKKYSVKENGYSNKIIYDTDDLDDGKRHIMNIIVNREDNIDDVYYSIINNSDGKEFKYGKWY
jgi:hypothetical protein